MNIDELLAKRAEQKRLAQLESERRANKITLGSKAQPQTPKPVTISVRPDVKRPAPKRVKRITLDDD